MIVCRNNNIDIDNLNRIRRCNNLGIYKKWILNDIDEYSLLCDCLEKINYSSQDLKYEIAELVEINRKSIVYIITLADWILGAYNRIKSLIRKDVIDDFKYEREDYFIDAEAYFKAIRSFVIAHPTKTTSHPKYGFDGNYICADIRNHREDITFSFVKQDRIKYISFNGMFDKKIFEPNFYLYVYSKKDTGMRFYSYVGVNYCDIYNVANVIIDKICELDTFLSKVKKSQYVSKGEL